MHAPPTPESLFLRWRADGDAEALGEVLAAVQDELLGVARRQSRDESSAQDLLQETLLTAISQAHRFDATQRLMPWLVGLLTVNVLRERRRGARTPDPVRVAQPGVERPEEGADRGEVRRVVAGAIEGLPDLYRDVLQQHLLEERSHAEIAERLGRAPGTIRVQVFRGLAQLRAALPASLSLGLALTLLVPRSEAAWAARVLDQAAAPAAPAAPLAAPLAAASAAPIALRWIAAGVLAAATAGAVWWTLQPSAEPRRSGAEVAGLAEPDGGAPAPAAGELATPAIPTGAPARRPLGTQASATAPRPGVWLVGEITGLDALTPADALALTLRPGDTRHPPRQVSLAAEPMFAVDLGAWYAADGPAPRDFFAVVDHPGALVARAPLWLDEDRLAAARAAARPGSEERVELRARFDLARAAASVVGRVRLPDGAPEAAEERVSVGLFQLHPDGEAAREPAEAAFAGADGFFALRTPVPGRHQLVIVRAGLAVKNLEVFLAPRDVRDLGDVELSAGLAIAGTVRTAGGQAAPHARVDWRAAEVSAPVTMHGRVLIRRNGRFEHANGSVVADPAGAFTIGALAAGPYLVRAAPAPRDARHVIALDDHGGFGTPVAAPPGEERVDAPAHGVVLAAGRFEVPLRVTGRGAPLADVDVERLFEGGGFQGADTDAQGRATLLTSGRPGAVALRVSKPGWEPATLTLDPARLDPAIEVHVDLERGPAPVELTLDAGGLDLSGCTAFFVPWEAIDAAGRKQIRESGFPPMPPGFFTRPLDAEGRVRGLVPAGHWFVHVRPGTVGGGAQLPCALPTDLELDLAPGVAVRHRFTLRACGRLRFVPVPAVAGASEVMLALETTGGERVRLEVTTLQLRADARQGRSMRVDRLPFDTPAESGGLEPGNYVLRASAGGRTQTLSIEVRSGETQEIALAF